MDIENNKYEDPKQQIVGEPAAIVLLLRASRNAAPRFTAKRSRL